MCKVLKSLPLWTLGVQNRQESCLEVSAQHCVCSGRSCGVRGWAKLLPLPPGCEQWGCHLAEASRKRSVRLTGFPIFPRTGFCSSAVIWIWKRQTCRSSKQAAWDQLDGWSVQEACSVQLRITPPLRLCAYTPPSQRKNPPNSGQPNRFPYIGKHELHSWWKNLTRNPVTWLTLHKPDWLRVSQPV